MTEAVHGQGIQLRVGANAAAVTATVLLGGLTNIPPPPFTRSFLEVTAHDSPANTREYIADLPDPGEMSVELFWTPGNATDDVITALMAETDTRLYQITWPQVAPDRIWSFRAFLTSFEPSGEVSGALTASMTLRVTGTITRSDGS
jgi:hypothetical protein